MATGTAEYEQVRLKLVMSAASRIYAGSLAASIPANMDLAVERAIELWHKTIKAIDQDYDHAPVGM
jgi:hypothetical protein